MIGAGTLGRRIALMLATQGGEVRLFDTAAEHQAAAVAFVEAELPRLLENRSDGSPGRAVASRGLADAVAETWLVVEALPERLELKRRVFAVLDQLAAGDTILATNSSSFSSSQIIDGVSRPQRVVNTHFYMPPFSNSVEIMSCGRTDQQVIKLLMETLSAYGLAPFEVRAESVGFIYNRIWAAIKREALAVVAEGVATPEEIDRIFQLSLYSPYGPFRAMDFVGLDVSWTSRSTTPGSATGSPRGRGGFCANTSTRVASCVKAGRGFYDDYREAQPRPEVTE